jgi:predicted Fe-Mo cluster-binding NifX family protein
MKIAIPTHGRNLTAHFGHCESFAIVQVEDKNIQHIEYVDPPEHRPGVYPRFLANAGVDVIIAGGMGQKAQQLFSQNGIEVVIGISEGKPEELVKHYLDEKLRPGENLCDH